MKKSHKKWETSVKKTQTQEKIQKNVYFCDKKWKTIEKKVTVLWKNSYKKWQTIVNKSQISEKKVTKSDKLV